MKNRLIVRLFVVGVVLVVLLAPVVTFAVDCGRGNLRESRKVSLHRTGISVVMAIEHRDIAGFMRYVRHQGVGFGVDQGPLSVEEIGRQLKMKEGIYCLLFSTPCIATSDPTKGFRVDEELSKWKISYAEWLALNKPYMTEIELEDDDPSEVCGGVFTVHGRANIKTAPKDFELVFIFENGRWMLTNTPNY
jgi:hypothetical protein